MVTATGVNTGSPAVRAPRAPTPPAPPNPPLTQALSMAIGSAVVGIVPAPAPAQLAQRRACALLAGQGRRRLLRTVWSAWHTRSQLLRRTRTAGSRISARHACLLLLGTVRVWQGWCSRRWRARARLGRLDALLRARARHLVATKWLRWRLTTAWIAAHVSAERLNLHVSCASVAVHGTWVEEAAAQSAEDARVGAARDTLLLLRALRSWRALVAARQQARGVLLRLSMQRLRYLLTGCLHRWRVVAATVGAIAAVVEEEAASTAWGNSWTETGSRTQAATAAGDHTILSEDLGACSATSGPLECPLASQAQGVQANDDASSASSSSASASSSTSSSASTAPAASTPSTQSALSAAIRRSVSSEGPCASESGLWADSCGPTPGGSVSATSGEPRRRRCSVGAPTRSPGRLPYAVLVGASPSGGSPRSPRAHVVGGVTAVQTGASTPRPQAARASSAMGAGAAGAAAAAAGSLVVPSRHTRALEGSGGSPASCTDGQPTSVRVSLQSSVYRLSSDKGKAAGAAPRHGDSPPVSVAVAVASGGRRPLG